MKKLVSVLLCAAMIFACNAAFAEGDFDYAGSWSLIAVEENGQIKTANEAGVSDMTMVLAADGTSKWYSVMENREADGTWQAVGGGISATDIDGAETAFVLDESGRLVCEDEGDKIVFSRSSSYCGTWTLRFGILEGDVYSVSEMGVDMLMVLREGGVCAMRSMGRTIQGTWSEGDGGVTIDISNKPVFFELEKGVLSSEDQGYRLCFVRDISICANAPAEAFTGKWELIDAYDCDTAYTEAALEEGLTFVLNDDGVVKRESKTKSKASNYLTWSMQEVEGLGTVATIREHSGDSHLDYEVYKLESGYVKLWNNEGRYQLYRAMEE